MNSWEATITGDSEGGILPMIRIDHYAPGETWALLTVHGYDQEDITRCLDRDGWREVRVAVTMVLDRMEQGGAGVTTSKEASAGHGEVTA